MAKLPSSVSWEDIRLAKVVGDHGGIAGAAVALGVNQSTISRRLAAIEKALDVTLFDRRRTGYVATAAGVEVIALGARIDGDVLEVSRRVSDRTFGHAGRLRVATSDILARDYLTAIIADFQRVNPKIRFEVVVRNEYANLARAEADVAFRATCSPPENLFGRKIADIGWAVYGLRLAFEGSPLSAQELREQAWISYGDGLRKLTTSSMVDELVQSQNIRLRINSVLGVMAAITSGAGIGFLPCMHGDLVPELIRLSAVDRRSKDELWILTHPAIRKSDRIDAFMSHCVKAILKSRGRIEGEDVASAGLPPFR